MKRAVNVVLSVFLALLLLLPSVFTVHAAGNAFIYVASRSNEINDSGYFRYDADTETWTTGLQSEDDWNIAYDEPNNYLTLRNLVIKDTDYFLQEDPNTNEVSVDPTAAEEARQALNGQSPFGAIGLRIVNYTPLTIDLQGSNSITLSNPKSTEIVPSDVFGLAIAGRKAGSITIQGSGSLTIRCTSTDLRPTNYPFVSAFAVYNTAGEIDMTGGTLDLNAEGNNAGIGFGAYGNDPSLLYSLKISGGSLTSKGIGDYEGSPQQKLVVGVGTGLAASRAVSISGGSVNAIGRGANRAFGINLYSGMETSGGDIIADADLLNGITIINPFAITAKHASDAQPPFSPAISINSPMSILEARNASGAVIADPVAFDYDDGTKNTRYVIGPENGASSDLAKYVHLGIPAAPAAAASSWVPSYEVRFLDCSGKLISDQWVAEGQPAEIPQGFTYKEEELSWVYRSLTVSPVSCKYSGYVVPNTADRG